MSEHNELGQEGEEAAARYLMFDDYSILERNWRFHHLELDIIAEKRGVLVIVEVKTRRDENFGEPEDNVTLEKQRRLVDAANAYVHFKNLDQEVRFDIISVVGTEKPFRIRHFINAFDAYFDKKPYCNNFKPENS